LIVKDPVSQIAYRKFFLVDSNKNRTEIPEFQWQFEIEQTKRRNDPKTAGITRKTTAVFSSGDNEKNSAVSYIVANYRYFENADQVAQQKAENWARAKIALEQCREIGGKSLP
jgi:hypothetical protein